MVRRHKFAFRHGEKMWMTVKHGKETYETRLNGDQTNASVKIVDERKLHLENRAKKSETKARQDTVD